MATYSKGFSSHSPYSSCKGSAQIMKMVANMFWGNVAWI